MYAIKARFDGVAVIPTEAIPVKEPYEVIITFTRPAESAEPVKKAIDSLDKFYGCFRENSPWEGDSVEIIRNIRDEW
jgi:hypothetical protein